MTRPKTIIQTQSGFALKSEPPGGAARLVEPSEQVSRACPASKLAPAEAESESLTAKELERIIVAAELNVGLIPVQAH